MAIGETPMFDHLSGSAGPVDFRTRRNHKIEIGKKRIPDQPERSDAQQEINQMYGYAVEIWRTSSADEQKNFSDEGDKTNITGFNWLLYLVIAPALYDQAKYDISRYGA